MRNLFKRTKKTKPGIITVPSAHAIYWNDSVDIIYNACKACYALNKEMDYEGKKQYIAKRVKAGHDSILEHSNVIILVCDYNKSYYTELIETMYGVDLPSKYINIRTSTKSNDEDSMNILIQGSIRGFKHFLKNANRESLIFSLILNSLYECTVWEFFCDMTDDNIEYDFINKDSFIKELIEPPVIENSYSEYHPINIESKDESKIEIVNIDPDENINTFLQSKEFTLINDTLDFCTVTVLFKNMSRTATHQLVRHRNAVTQESQRYVNYSDCGFTTPDLSYIKDQKATVDIIEGGKKVKLTDLGKEQCKIYPRLIKLGLKKEDARAFLPSNVQCGKLYMTFTFRSLMKFIELRTDPHAQKEIREYANILKETIKPEMECYFDMLGQTK